MEAQTSCEITITEPEELLCTVTLDNGVSINGLSDGMATVMPTGGSQPYSYEWDNGETTQQALALAAGLHSVIVTDTNGCQTTCEVDIPEPGVLSCTADLVQHVSCHGGNDGSATASITGGVLPFSYSWDNGETTQTAITLNAGLHTVMVTDANGAQTSCQVLIEEPDAPEAGENNMIAVCDGTIVDLTTLVTVPGGSFDDPANSGGLNGTNFDTSGLAPAEYTIEYVVAGATANCPVDKAFIVIKIEETNDAGEDNATSVCEGTIVDLTTLVSIPGGTFTGAGVSGSSFDTTGLTPGSYEITYTVSSGNSCPDDTAKITIVVAEDVVEQACKVLDVDFCNPDKEPYYSFYWSQMRTVADNAEFFSQNATHTLTFTEFTDGTALIEGNVQSGTCSAELYIALKDKKDWTTWSADGGGFKPQGCNPDALVKEALRYYVVDGTKSHITTTGGDCLERRHLHCYPTPRSRRSKYS